MKTGSHSLKREQPDTLRKGHDITQKNLWHFMLITLALSAKYTATPGFRIIIILSQGNLDSGKEFERRLEGL